jgi:16S rRNA (uracil1498-N3)-methyltransferase
VHRFYAPDLDPAQPSVVLPADEMRHLTRVLRLAPGAVVAVFDGRGRECVARVEPAERGRVRLTLLEARQPVPEPFVALTLAQAVLKGDKMDDVVRDAVMLGVADVLPVVSARSETTLALLRKARRVERWQRIAVSSAKQCGRAVVPPVREPVRLSSLLNDADGDGHGLRLALVEPSQREGCSLDTLSREPRPAAALVLVGPEGGWTAGEADVLAGARFRLVRIGSRILRADAVPVAALTLLQFIWGDLS